MPIITSLVLSHPHITFHKVALSAAEKIETHPAAIAEKADFILPLAHSRQAPVAGPVGRSVARCHRLAANE